MKTYALFSFLGILLLFFCQLSEKPSTERLPASYELKVTSSDAESVSLTANWYYVDKDSNRIEKKESLITPYEVSIEAIEFRGTFKKTSGTGVMQITVKDDGRQLISTFDKALIEIRDGGMHTRRVD